MDIQSICQKGTPYRTRKRLGRGTGSGTGKTSGRGHKGWGARSGSSQRPGYEGGQMPIYRRVPKRGFTNARFRKDYTVVNVSDLEVFAEGDVVDLNAVLERGLASLKAPLFKVLGNGELGKKLTVRAQKFSKSAEQKITAAGGSVERLDERGRPAEGGAAAPAEASTAPSGTPSGAPEADTPDATTDGDTPTEN